MRRLEQLEGRDADARTDIFAFGAILYEMLTENKAFEGKSQAGLTGAILEREPTPISSLRPATPRSLERVISKCLKKNPYDLERGTRVRLTTWDNNEQDPIWTPDGLPQHSPARASRRVQLQVRGRPRLQRQVRPSGVARWI